MGVFADFFFYFIKMVYMVRILRLLIHVFTLEKFYEKKCVIHTDIHFVLNFPLLKGFTRNILKNYHQNGLF